MRGTGARYIQSRGRWNSGSSAESKVRSHEALRPSPSALPVAVPNPSLESPMWMYSSSPAPTSASVSFTADGGSPSKSVNHSDP